MRMIVLGSAAGGGLPQWNCACANCTRARAGDPAVRPRTQSSIAVSADGRRWVLLNASPDLRQQMAAAPALAPPYPPRSTALAGVLVTNADIDHVAGLLSLREAQSFVVHATARVHSILDANPVFDSLDRSLVRRRTIGIGASVDLETADGEATGLSATLFPVPGKVALYLEDARAEHDLAGEAGDTVGVEIRGGGKRILYIPACARIDDDLLERARGADLLLFDGTLWEDGEMVRMGLSAKTGRRMGHVSVSGADGTIARFAGVAVGRKVLIHLNNSNPLLADDSPERAAATRAGWEVAYDGQEFTT
ncbi:MAG TPA: pyrroloquinoline quinone biosynthesis protein PqqB [Arenibaculum sp.]|nr:pyrroloquinoline quinone biosynthesis protein PqqB [Arenibaculum sp.]